MLTKKPIADDLQAVLERVYDAQAFAQEDRKWAKRDEYEHIALQIKNTIKAVQGGF